MVRARRNAYPEVLVGSHYVVDHVFDSFDELFRELSVQKDHRLD